MTLGQFDIFALNYSCCTFLCAYNYSCLCSTLVVNKSFTYDLKSSIFDGIETRARGNASSLVHSQPLLRLEENFSRLGPCVELSSIGHRCYLSLAQVRPANTHKPWGRLSQGGDFCS